MNTKLFQVGEPFGVADANDIVQFRPVSTFPDAADIDTGVVVLYTPEMALYRWNGSTYDRIPPAPAAAMNVYHGMHPIDQANDIILMVKTPSPLVTATIKLLGLNFPSYFYTEYAARSLSGSYTANTTIDHTHTGSVSGTTGNNSNNHTHEYLKDQAGGPYQTGNNSVNHTHSFTDSFTTSNNSATHKHGLSFTLPGSTQKATFTGSLLQVFVSTNMTAWSEIQENFSGIYNATGTPIIDITSSMTANSINYIKLSLNTPAAVGGLISHYIEIQ